MTAILWKELRENIRWASLGALLLAAILLYALYDLDQGWGGFDPYSNTGITLAKKKFLTATTFGFAAVGFLLGLIQILPELNPDRWAGLLHRPAHRGTIFAGKALAGLLLYLLATAAPLGLCILLVAIPGNFPSPFVPAMIQPSVADLLGGIPYYFAALAIALLPSGHTLPGKVLRVLPLFAALNATFFLLATDHFRVAAEAALLTALLLAVAGWGIIRNRSHLHARPRLTQFAFIATIFYSLCGLGELARTVLETLLPEPDDRWSSYEITDDGVPYRLDYHNGVIEAVTDVNGDPATGKDNQPDSINRHTAGMNWVSRFVGDSHGWKPNRWNPSYRESNTYLYSTVFYQQPRTEQWFDLPRTNEIIGFAPYRKAAVARLGPAGFLPPPTHPPRSRKPPTSAPSTATS